MKEVQGIDELEQDILAKAFVVEEISTERTASAARSCLASPGQSALVKCAHWLAAQ